MQELDHKIMRLAKKKQSRRFKKENDEKNPTFIHYQVSEAIIHVDWMFTTFFPYSHDGVKYFWTNLWFLLSHFLSGAAGLPEE